jgi:hypothetical protein
MRSLQGLLLLFGPVLTLWELEWPCSVNALSSAPTTFTRPSTGIRRAFFALNARSDNDPFVEDPYNVATLLLGTVIERRAQELDPSFDALLSRFTPSYKEIRAKQKERIEGLIDELRDFNNQYDPIEALLGEFYATVYWYYPNPTPQDKPPLWEQLSLKVQNVKGQQYYFNRDFVRKVKNYSEVWGPDFHITADGYFSPVEPPRPSNKKSKIQEFFQAPEPEMDDRMRKCPDTYKVEATKVTLNAWGTSIAFPIKGSSNLVILYADRRMRIFVSPLPSETVVGKWEDAGLVVVQVRGDLVCGDDSLDLR